jgi:hypothetical protein
MSQRFGKVRMVWASGALTASSTLLGCQTPGLAERQPPTIWPLSLDVHFVSPAPVPFPGSAGLQPGSRSHARAWRSQGKPWRTGSGCMKQTSSLAHRHSWHDVFAYQLKYLAHPTDIATAIFQDKPDQNILRGSGSRSRWGYSPSPCLVGTATP